MATGNTVEGVTLLATEAATAAMQAEAAAVTGQGDPVAPAPASPNSRLFTEEELEAARRQEKDKLYTKLSKLEEELETIRKDREDAARIAREAAEAEDAARREREEAEMSAKELLTKKEDEWKSTLNAAQQEWEQKFMALQQESEARQAMLDKEREFQEIQSYMSRRIQEEQANLMPELMDDIKGNSIEEIEAAIQSVITKTSAIMQKVQPLLEQAQQRPRGISTTGAIPSGPLDNATEQQVITVSDVKDMSMEQWAQVRGRLGLK
jgi:DNA repair exonuclease SbcCD ATPase subunit